MGQPSLQQQEKDQYRVGTRLKFMGNDWCDVLLTGLIQL